MPSDIEAVAAEAWNEVKDKADPEFGDCARAHRDKLITHAASVRDTGLLEFATDFERKVAEVLAKPKKKTSTKETKSKAKEK